jgi:tRNA A37 threonylcarbamoyladenosine dehydratase
MLLAADEFVQDLRGRRVLEVLRQQVCVNAGACKVGNWSVTAVRRGGLQAVKGGGCHTWTGR